jgi:hypothetical protein
MKVYIDINEKEISDFQKAYKKEYTTHTISLFESVMLRITNNYFKVLKLKHIHVNEKFIPFNNICDLEEKQQKYFRETSNKEKLIDLKNFIKMSDKKLLKVQQELEEIESINFDVICLVKELIKNVDIKDD